MEKLLNKTFRKIIFAILITTLFFTISISAHVPYFEHFDFSEHRPFRITKPVEQSIAVYAWLDNSEDELCKDIDVYMFRVGLRPIKLYAEVIVPVVEGYYQNFTPWFAVVGPGLPEPNQSLPFKIPENYGVYIKENVKPGEQREQFYEPFGGKSYYEGPIFEMTFEQPGKYYVYYWDPYEKGGDYVAVIGKLELFGPIDILRALIYTPLIRQDVELHLF